MTDADVLSCSGGGVLRPAATLAAVPCAPLIRINRFQTLWITKLYRGFVLLIFISLSLACGVHSVVGTLGLFGYASDPAVTSDAG